MFFASIFTFSHLIVFEENDCIYMYMYGKASSPVVDNQLKLVFGGIYVLNKVEISHDWAVHFISRNCLYMSLA